MKTLKFLIFCLTIASVSNTVMAQRGVRIAYIDMEYILESVPEYKEATTQLEGKVQRWKQDIEKKQKDIDQMKLNLSNERVLLTKELIEERDEEIKIKEDELLKYQQDRFGPQGDLIIQRSQLVQPIQDQVFNIIQEIGENKKYDFIFDKSADVVMLYVDKRNDISETVLRSINRAAKREEVTTKQEKREVEQRDALTDDQDAVITEREKAVDEKKDERQAIIDARTKDRDSIRAARKAEFEARRTKLLEDRNRKRDSILETRQNRNSNAPPSGDTNNGDGN